MNTKKDRILFCNEAKEIILANGFKEIEDFKFEQGKDDELNFVRYQLKTDKNCLVVKLNNYKDHCLVYSVTGILETPSKTIGNPYSGKVNFHSMKSNVRESIADFEDHLKLIIESEL